MPELPEVESIRRSLEAHLVGRKVVRVRIERQDIVCAPSGGSHLDLLASSHIKSLRRHGKQMAIIADDRRALVIQLGMTGRMHLMPKGRHLRGSDARHCHVKWLLDDGTRLIYQDSRRFGRLTPCASVDHLEDRWSQLGPDALLARPERLRNQLVKGQRAVKAVLLDQRRIAGVGNIYADEALFGARLNPMRPLDSLSEPDRHRLVHHVRVRLRSALRHGGTTFSDHRTPDGSVGSWGSKRQVHGRRGAPCVNCAHPLSSGTVASRTTVWCDRCQA